MERHITSLVRDGIRTVTLDRPPHNAVTDEMMIKLLEIFQLSNHDWDTRVVVIESALPDVFSAGLDTDGPEPPRNEPYDSFGVPSTGMALVRNAYRGIWDSKWPIIAKVNGTALNEGMLLAALCDFAIVRETAKLGMPRAPKGDIGGAGILRRCLSEHAARYLLWSGRILEGRDLRGLGAGLRIVADGDVDSEVDALATELASRDPHVLRHMKIALNEIEQGDPLGILAIEQKYTALLRAKSKNPGS